VSCLFCEIVAGRIPARVAYQDDAVLAFHDINPQGPVHILVIPKRHITSVLDLTPGDDELVGSLVRRATDLARAEGLAERGFRLVFNCRRGRGLQRLPHPPAPGGRPQAGWPPG
jgi:histidine triad (HIT) family protein